MWMSLLALLASNRIRNMSGFKPLSGGHSIILFAHSGPGCHLELVDSMTSGHLCYVSSHLISDTGMPRLS